MAEEEYEFTSARLGYREPLMEDAQWIHTIQQDPEWIRFIGNRGVHSISDAKRYIELMQDHKKRWGYGLWVAQLQSTGEPVGLCGLVTRQVFRCPDLGFALRGEYRGMGYGTEAGEAVLGQAAERYHFDFVTGMAHKHNERSRKLLARLGFCQQGKIFVPGMERQRLYWRVLNPTGSGRR